MTGVLLKRVGGRANLEELADGSRWSFRAQGGGRPPESRVGWPSTPEECQT